MLMDIMTASPSPRRTNERGHHHAEAFCLMWYACASCAHREQIWNSRDGVTPFETACPSCGSDRFAHIDFGRDAYAPNHKPHHGQRVWVSMTKERALARAEIYLALLKAKYPAEDLQDMTAKPLAESFHNNGEAPDLAIAGYDFQPVQVAAKYHGTPVAEFHMAYGHPLEAIPTVPTIEQRLLRVNMLAEELTEFAEACGVRLTIECTSDGIYSWNTSPARDGDDSCNLVEAADALGDLRYIVDGGNLIFGFPGEQVLQEIHRSNMSKLGADGKPITRADGKTLKGPNYFKPNIAGILHAAQVESYAGPWERDNDVTHTLVHLVDLKVISPEVIAAWTDEECKAADGYARAVHLHASDSNDVVVPPLPECLKPFQWAAGDPERYKLESWETTTPKGVQS